MTSIASLWEYGDFVLIHVGVIHVGEWQLAILQHVLDEFSDLLLSVVECKPTRQG